MHKHTPTQTSPYRFLGEHLCFLSRLVKMIRLERDGVIESGAFVSSFSQCPFLSRWVCGLGWSVCFGEWSWRGVLENVCVAAGKRTLYKDRDPTGLLN